MIVVLSLSGIVFKSLQLLHFQVFLCNIVLFNMNNFNHKAIQKTLSSYALRMNRAIDYFSGDFSLHNDKYVLVTHVLNYEYNDPPSGICVNQVPHCLIKCSQISYFTFN